MSDPQPGPPAKGERTVAELERENAYLKMRVAQLEGDVTDLSAENHRLQELRERLYGRTQAAGAAGRPNPLGSGQ